MSDVVIIGAGGHAKVIADIVVKCGDRLLGFLDDSKTGAIIGEYSVIGKICDTDKFSNAEFIIAIGSNEVRKRIAGELDVKWYTAVHPNACLGMDVNIGEGTCVMANTVINSNANVGSHAIINTGAIIEHDCLISDFVHVSPNATLCGTVNVGVCTHIGASATVKNNVRICGDVTVGAGAVVVKDIIEHGIYVGVPAKKIK
ncbi:MAG: acetyltransferase [Ruminococcaceae bacterium]|nr:acetyltransferase [Oscillospiraceae bacterium]